MSHVIMSVEGIDGRIELLEDRVRICRSGFLAYARGLTGDKDILLSQISSVEFRPASYFTGRGHITFSFLGGAEDKTGFLRAASDANSMLFKVSQMEAFKTLKTEVETRIAAGRNQRSGSSNLDELQKLAELHNKNIITDEEFNAKKRQLLGL